MNEAHAHMMSSRGLLAIAAASALAIPVGLLAPAGAAAPTQRVLLSATGELNEVAAAVTAAGGTVVETFDIASALVADLPETASVPQGSFVVPNVTMSFNSAPSAASVSDSVNTYLDTIDAPAGAGDGVTVAVVDTGVDEAADITVSDRVNVSGDATGDGYGHGTFMAGLVAGDDADFGGVAPDATVFDVQVAAADGSTDLARVLAGLQAVADKRAEDSSLDVAMLALSADSPLPPYLDPMTRALDRLWDEGVTVVVASGNSGTISSPATDPTILVVGSVDEADTAARDDDSVADFSGYGESMGVERPDLVAPGVSLIASAAKGSEAYLQNPDSHVGDGFLKGTGTSMSAAVTAGAVAALIAERPSLTPTKAKRLLVGSAYGVSGKGAGSGGLDLGAALATDLSQVPGVEEGEPATEYGPVEADAATWDAFAQAWIEGDLRAAAKAWSQLSVQTRKWAANAWSIAALVKALQTDEDTWDGRKWAGRKWATQAWEGRKWAEDEWVGRKWADEAWLDEVWDGRKWAGRKWANVDWLAFAWTVRMVADDEEIGAVLEGEDEWDGRKWAGRKWANINWVGRKWASEAWSGRKWADYSWDGRKWADGDWSGRKWADFAFEGRKWANGDWDGRKWAVQGW